MKEHIIEFKDITDSKEFIESKVPNFVLVFTYLITFFLLILLVWMWFSKIDIVVKANGMVRPIKTVSTLININGGVIREIHYFENKEVKKGEVLYVVDTTSLKLQKETLENTLFELQNDIKELKILEKSVKDEVNYFSSNKAKYFNKYQHYISRQEQLKIEYYQMNNKYNNSIALGESFISVETLKEYRSKLESIKATISTNKNEILFSTVSERTLKEEELIKLINQKKELEKNIGESKVIASIDGYIQVIKEFNKGDFINPNVEVLRIIPKDSKLKMEISIDNKDISHVRPGVKAKLRLLAFPYKEYGVIEGEIVNIGEDAIVDTQNNRMTYKAEASIPTETLYNREGKEGRLKVGMMSEVRIVTKRKRILHIVLEKLDFMKEM